MTLAWVRIALAAAVGACCVSMAGAYGNRGHHDWSVVDIFAGFKVRSGESGPPNTPWGKMVTELNGMLDAVELDDIRFGTATTHRDLYHPFLFGEEPTTQHLKSIAQSYAENASSKTGVRHTTEAATELLLRARKAYFGKCIATVQEATGLNARQAEALAGILHCIHLLGDSDPSGNTFMGVLPDVDRFVEALDRHLTDLFDGGDAKVWREVSRLREELKGLQKASQILPGGTGKKQILYRMATLKKLREAGLGRLLNQCHGVQLAKMGIVFNEAWAQKVTSWVLENGVLRLGGSKALKTLQENGFRDVADFNRQLRALERAAAKFCPGIRRIQQVAVLQTLRSSSGKVVQVLTVPTRPLARGVASGMGAGVLTLVWGQGMTYAMYQAGALTDDEFLTETKKNCGAALIAGTTTFVLVTLGASPAGLVILGVGAATDILYGLTFDRVQWVRSFSWEHDWIFGEMPTEIQRRRTLFSGDGPALFQFPKRTGFLNAMDDPESRARTTPLDWSNNPTIQKRGTLFQPAEREDSSLRRNLPI